MKEPRHKLKRRNCYDRLRARYLQAQRARRTDPAASAAMQLLVIFATIFGRLPLPTIARVNARYTPPLLSPAATQRTEMARRMGVPFRYLDLVLSQGQVPYGVLFNHIRQGGVLRRDAMMELRKRAPEASLDWLEYIQKWDRWSELLCCYVPKEQEELIDDRVLHSTVRWLEHLRDNANGHPGPVLETHNGDTDPQKPKV
ncbi:hypothetical protein ACCS33_22775 [Rhizobium ruizarguesonis]